MDSANLEKFKDQIKKSVLLDHYLPFIKLEDSGSRCVLICQCRQTNVSVTVTVQELPSSYNMKSILEKAYTHPQLTPLINCIDDTKAKLLIGVSTNPSGEYIEDYFCKNKNKTKPFFRRNVQFIMVKLLSMLNAMHERGIGLYPFNEKSVILTTTNGGDVIDLVVRRCHLYGNSNSATKQKAHLLYVAQKLGYIGDIIEDADLTKIELDFFRACHRDSKVTVAELMEMQYIKKDPESWIPKNKVIGGYVFNIKPVTKDNAVVPEVAEAAPVSVDTTAKMFDLSSLSDVGPATASVPKPVEDDNISVHTAIEDDLLEWSITISLGNGSQGLLSPTIKTVEDFIKKHATLINTAAEGNDDTFGFRLPNVAKSFKPGHYRFKSAFIKFGNHRQITFVDKINFCGAALLILFNDHGIEHVRQGNEIYKTFDSMPSLVADYLVAARLAINKLDAVAPIYIACSKKYNSKFMLHRDWTITLQNGDYEVVLTSEDIINQTEISTLVTNENCLKTLEMALKMPLREQCSPKNQRFYPDCYFKGNQMKVAATKFTGTVKYYSYEHDSGFITRDDGEDDIFVQRFSIAKSALRPFERYLVAGEKVEFNVGEYKTGDPEAVNVTGPDGSEVEGDFVLVQRKRFP